MKNESTFTNKIVPISVHPVRSLIAQLDEWTNRVSQRAYELFQGRGFADGHDLDDWLAAERELFKPLSLEVKDTKDAFIISANVPGFEAKDLEIQVDGSRLILQGKHAASHEEKEKDGATLYTERKAQEMYRMVHLPAPVVVERAQADLKNGILEVKLPKATTETIK